jgi:predicted nucleotidyltransferase
MERQTVLQTLREHETELKAAGIAHLRLFGSVARGDQSPGSDIDLLADFDEGSRVSLLTVIHIENRLSNLFGCKVDLISSKGLREFARKGAEQDAVPAF